MTDDVARLERMLRNADAAGDNTAAAEIAERLDALMVAGPQQQPTSNAAKAAVAVGAAGVGALGAWGATRGIKAMLPWITPTRSALNRIDTALKADFEGKGIREMYPEYMKLVRESGKPLTLADYVALKSHRTPKTTEVMNEFINQGGKPNVISETLTKRGEGQRERVMDMLAQELGVPKKTLNESLEVLKEQRRTASKPLYDEAFRDTTPTRDTNLLALFEKGTMTDALKGAEEIARLRGRDVSTRYAGDPARKNAWRMLLKQEVPDEMKIGPETAGGLQKYISPNIEELHNVRESLWDLYSSNKRAGDSSKASAYLDSWKSLTDWMDKGAPEAYRKARMQYKADSDVMHAHEIGSELFKQNPDDLRKLMLAMGPDQRTALAQGMYGSLMDMNDPKFVREVISNAPLYRKQRDLLSAVFPNTQGLHNFLTSLEGERAMLAGERRFAGEGSAAKRQSDWRERAGVSVPLTGSANPKAWMLGLLPRPPYDPLNVVPRRGARILFDEPSATRGVASHPYAEDIRTHLLPKTLGYPKSEFITPLAGGALGALGGYGSVSGMDIPDRVPSGLENLERYFSE